MALKKDELTNPASCLNKAGTRERIFVLRENDPLFAQTVRHWATMADGIHEPAKIKEATELADAAQKAREDRDRPTAEEVNKCSAPGCTYTAARYSNYCGVMHERSSGVPIIPAKS